MPDRLAKKVLIVGWDAADWKIIDSSFERGLMPNLRRLVDDGMRGDLSTLYPMLSPLLWTSIATGKTADKHGVLNFVEPDLAGQSLRVASSTTRRTKALWNILTQAGLRTNVVSWYASHPAEPIRGTVVSNLFQEGAPSGPSDPWPIPAGAVHPSWRADQIATLRCHPAGLTHAELRNLLPQLGRIEPGDRRHGLLAKLVAQGLSVHCAALDLLGSDEPWDCTMVFYDTIDVVGHHFMQYHSPRMAHVSERDFARFGPVVPEAYQLLDRMLGDLLSLAGPDTAVVLLSDHGFHSDHLRPRVQAALEEDHSAIDANWHRPLGVLVLHGAGIKRADRVHGASLLDITPTALALLGIAVGADMDGRVLVEVLEGLVEPARVESWDSIDGDAGMHPPNLRQDPFESRDAMNQLADLGYIQPLSADIRQSMDAAARETRFNLGVVYLTTHRHREATPIFEGLHEEVPGESRYGINLARCYYARGRYTDARRVLEGAISDDPSSPDAKFLLGAALFAERRLDEARAVLETAHRDNADRPDVASALGDVYVFLRRWDDAARVFAHAITLDPHDPRAHHGMAWVALGRGQFELAAEHCLNALGLRHSFPDAHYTLGVALTWLEDLDDAVKAFNVALGMEPGLVDAHRYLGLVFRKRGDTAAAAAHDQLAEQLSLQTQEGGPGAIQPVHGPPLGPLEWARRVGLSDHRK